MGSRSRAKARGRARTTDHGPPPRVRKARDAAIHLLELPHVLGVTVRVDAKHEPTAIVLDVDERYRGTMRIPGHIAGLPVHVQRRSRIRPLCSGGVAKASSTGRLGFVAHEADGTAVGLTAMHLFAPHTPGVTSPTGTSTLSGDSGPIGTFRSGRFNDRNDYALVDLVQPPACLALPLGMGNPKAPMPGASISADLKVWLALDENTVIRGTLINRFSDRTVDLGSGGSKNFFDLIEFELDVPSVAEGWSGALVATGATPVALLSFGSASSGMAYGWPVAAPYDFLGLQP